MISSGDYAAVIGLALLGSVVALAGILVFFLSKRASKLLQRLSVPFAAGVLLSVSMIGLLPEAVHQLGESAYLLILSTFFLSYFFEYYFFALHHHEHHGHGEHIKSSVPIVIVGDTIHNFVDGVAIAAAYLVHPGLGLVTAISTLLHEIPHEIGDFGVLLSAGWSKLRALTVNIISSLVTIFGAMFVLWFGASGTMVGVLLAFATGMFLYLGASDFLPDPHSKQSKPLQSLLAVIIGAVSIVLVLQMVPHAHEDQVDSTHEEVEVDHDQ